MANLFDQYGIKEVADVIVYEIDQTTGAFGKPILFFDSLKISTVEQTGETVDARGGKGNPKLISWSYNKDIMVTLQDALISQKSLEFMMGKEGVTYKTPKQIRKAEVVTLNAGKTFTIGYPAVENKVYVLDLGETFIGTGANNTIYVPTNVAATNAVANTSVRVAYSVFAAANKSYEIFIKPDTFPGTYALVGDTYIRNSTGKDEGFQFIIPKCKFGTDVTFTMEAEGDPSVFDMSITVLKANNGSMMSLVKYDIGTPTSAADASNLL